MKIKKTKKMSVIKLVLSFILILASVFMLYKVFIEVSTYFALQKELEEVSQKLQEIKKQEEKIKEKRDLLENPGYIKRYARGKYLLTKDGEQIFKFSLDDDE